MKKRIEMIISLMLSFCLIGCTSAVTSETASAASSTSAAATIQPTASASASPTAEATVLPEGSSFSVQFIDVGQGDASLVSCDGHYMLIDGGTSDQSSKIYTILQNKGITHLDYIVCSHPHADHAGGLSGALQYASCDLALAPVTSSDNSAFTKFVKKLNENNVPLQVPSVGDTYALGSAVITVLGPTDIESVTNVNNESLVLRIDYGSTSFLFPGDAEQEEQQLLLYHDISSLNVTVLKAAHHGSSNGTSSAWIKAVSPQMTVISCGKNNSYGHPHEQTLNLLKQYGSAVYRTDIQGDIVISSTGTAVSASVEKNADADVWTPGSSTVSDTQSSAESTAAVSNGIQSYVVNTNTKKFHTVDCKYASTIKEKNCMDYTGDRQDLIDQGYKPCSYCRP